MRVGTIDFSEVVVADTEYSAPPGERPQVVCVVAHELVSGRVHRIPAEQLYRMPHPPYPIGPDALFLAYYASAEIGCHLALGWPAPANVLDLYVEFSNIHNGLDLPYGRGLLGALLYYGLDAMDATEKDSMRQLAIRGGPYTPSEMVALLDYCETDVIALKRLLNRMGPGLDTARAILRGRSMIATARMEYCGVPIDVPALAALRANWSAIRSRLIQVIDAAYGVYDGTTFKANQFARYLAANNILWPTLPSGALMLDDDTFREMARLHPQLGPLRELRCYLSQMRQEELAVGRDGRNRTMLSAFRASTSRNQPSNTKFIFGPARWLRSLIRPQRGYGLAYIDWAQQEFGIAAALSGDTNMIEAYHSGDPYLAFAKQAGAAPAEATRKTHDDVREQYKECALGVLYAMGPDTLALRINQCPAAARELLRMHRKRFPTFWPWSDAAVDHAMLYGELHTAFGWTIHTGPMTNPRSLRNFPMQANGAEMLRLACCFATERGIAVCAPVHDAILIEARLEDLDDAVVAAQKAMSDASALVLDGFRLRSDVKIVRYPERYHDDRGKEMWDRVWGVMAELSQEMAVIV